MSDDLSADYVLMNDIDASMTKDWNSGSGFDPVGNGSTPFTGSLDGLGHTLSNLFIYRNSTSYVGLFGWIDSGGLISNISMLGNNITGNSYAGGLVGMNGGSVVNSSATGSVTGDDNVGGLVGGNQGSVENSYSTGCVIGDYGIGGLAGSNFGSVEKSYSTGCVTGEDTVGGLVGENSYGLVETSYAMGNVSGNYCVGGLVGLSSYGFLINSYATGTVAGNISVGGFIGCNSWYNSLENSYATGNVTGDDGVGGLVGYNDLGSISDSYWDIITSGKISSDGGIGKTTEEMRMKSTFTDAGWDFTEVWGIKEDVTYPSFIWQDKKSPVADAGSDQMIDEGMALTFDATNSTDNVEIVNFTWTFTQDGSSVTLYGVSPSYQFNEPDLFVITLTVTDSAGNWNTDTVIVTVTEDVIDPVADAGADQAIDKGTLATFDGSHSTDNVGIANFTWTFTDGTPVTLYGIGPSYQFNDPGVYPVTLNVTDQSGNWDSEIVNVTVIDMTDPMADAGPDQLVDEGSVVRFDGSNSSDNAQITNYTWTITHEGTSVTLYGIGPSYEVINPGDYTVTLIVIDSSGNNDSDTMKITVTPLDTDDDEDFMIAGINGSIVIGAILVVIIGIMFLMKKRSSR